MIIEEKGRFIKLSLLRLRWYDDKQKRNFSKEFVIETTENNS